MNRVAFLFGVVAAGWLAAATALSAQPVSEPTDEAYRLQPGDTVALTVLEDPNLNREVLVRPDGRITLPIVGSLMAAGRTPEQVSAAVEARLSASFEIMPTVSLALTGTAPDREAEIPPAIYVMGQVRNPGPVALPEERPLTVLQALATAGGLDRFAAGKRITVRRLGEDGPEIIAFDYEAMEAGEVSAAADLPLVAGDVIVVPERTPFE